MISTSTSGLVQTLWFAKCSYELTYLQTDEGLDLLIGLFVNIVKVAFCQYIRVPQIGQIF